MTRLRVAVAVAALAAVTMLVHAPARAAGADQSVLRHLSLPSDEPGLQEELRRLAAAPVRGDYVQRVLHIARFAADAELPDLAHGLLKCYLRLPEPLDQWSVAQALARLGYGGSLPPPEGLLNTHNPAAVLLAVELLARQADKSAAERLFALARERGGWAALHATGALRRMDDPRHVPLARHGLMSEDEMLRLAYFRLLRPADRPKGFRLFAPQADRLAALRNAQSAEPAPRAAEAYVVVQRKPERLLEVTPQGQTLLDRALSMELVLAYRPARGQMLLVAPTRFWMQEDDGTLLWQCAVGHGPQNDVIGLGDGTYLVADGGAFSSERAKDFSRLYVYDPLAGKATWELPTDRPLSVRAAQAGTFLIARGSDGLAWVDGRDGRLVRHLVLPEPCIAAEVMDNGDALVAAGSRLVRLSPAGAITWSYDAGAPIISLSLVEAEPGRYVLGLAGRGLTVIDARDPGEPAASLLLKLDAPFRAAANNR